MATDLELIRAANRAIIQSQPLVAVFFGGNSGIGHYTLRELCHAAADANGKGFRAYIVGRNPRTAAEVIAECVSIYPNAQCTFVQARDLSLIGDVDRVCAEVIQLEERQTGRDATIDYLIMCQAGSIFLPRTDTREGIDATMSLMYYSRMRMVLKLLPLLLRSQLPATVVSVYNPGSEKQFFPEDLSLRDLKLYSYPQARSHMCYMHTLFFEKLARQHPGKLSLVHVFPGIVFTPAFQSPDFSVLFRLFLGWVIFPLFGWFMVPPALCGARMLSLASSLFPPGPGSDSTDNGDIVQGTNGKRGGGSYSLSRTLESNYKTDAYAGFDKQQMGERVWSHTVGVFETIERGDVFRD